MNRRDLALLVAAMAFGLLAALLASRYLKQVTHKGEAFVVAVETIKQGQAIEAKHVKLSEPISNASADELFLQTGDVVGKIALVDIKRGALVRRQEVTLPKVEKETQKRKAKPIPSGMSSFEITIKEVLHIPESLEIGSFVDIVGRVNDHSEADHMRTVVHSAEVLSIEEEEGEGLKSFSVAVIPEEAETLASATTLGKVQVILRSEAGDKPRFSHSGGVMEVVRGVKQAQTITFTTSGRLWKGKIE